MKMLKADHVEKRAVTYARVSSEEQTQGYSIDAQLRACRDWAKTNGYSIVKEYVDEGRSASKNLEKREFFKAMVADATVKDHPFDVVIVHKLDRFSRDTIESLTMKALLKRHNVRLVSVLEPMVGADSPTDHLVEHILVGMNAFYPANLAVEIRKGLRERVQQHHLVFGPPFGFKSEIVEKLQGHKRTRTISRAIIDEKAAPIARRVAKVRRWEEALEKGLLLLEDCAGRIKELRHDREALLQTKGRITEEVSRAGKDIADTDSANGRIYPTDADAAQGEKKSAIKKSFSGKYSKKSGSVVARFD